MPTKGFKTFLVLCWLAAMAGWFGHAYAEDAKPA